MPIQSCRVEEKPGFKYGPGGRCYPYTPGDEKSRQRAIEKARLQGRAIKRSQNE